MRRNDPFSSCAYDSGEDADEDDPPSYEDATNAKLDTSPVPYNTVVEGVPSVKSNVGGARNSGSGVGKRKRDSEETLAGPTDDEGAGIWRDVPGDVD